DHRRLDALLDAAECRDPIDLGPYDELRRGLLRHIGIEEKILLPAAQVANGGVPLDVAARLRLDHGAIAALMGPTPTLIVTGTLRHVLRRHNPIEEGPDGLYATCDRLLIDAVTRIVAEMQAFAPIPVSPHNDAPGVMAAVERALDRAGYRLVG